MSRKTPEKKVQDKIIDYLKELESQEYPILHFRRDASGPEYKKGLPDLFLVIGPYHIEVEVKAEGGSLRADQERWGRRFTNIGGFHWVTYSFNEFKDLLTIFMLKYFDINLITYTYKE